MIIAKIDDEAFLDTVRNARLIAFQRLEFGYAVATPLVAFYAPLFHPGGGNLPREFFTQLEQACLRRMSDPYARTLRPTAKSIPTEALRQYLMQTFGVAHEPMQYFDKASGDRPEIVEFECQVVIQAIEEFERPELREAMRALKREMLSEALDLVIEHAETARQLCEEEDKPARVKMNIMQATTAMKTCLEMLLKP